MARSVRYTRHARADLLDIWLETAKRDVAAADRFYELLESRVKILEDFAGSGPARSDIAEDARMLVEGSHLILYRIRSDDVQIVRVLHGSRDIGAALFRAGIDD